MSRTLNKLTAREVATLKEAGRHSDGGGLYLRVTPSKSRTWLFMMVQNGKRAEISLGPVNAISLATARRLAAEMREAAALGHDPRSVLAPAKIEKTAPEPSVVTFGEFAETYIRGVEDGWRNPVHRQQWRNSLRDHAAPLHDLPIDGVDTDAILEALRPIWLTKAETAQRVRGRIEKILSAVKVKNLRPRDSINPATWRGHLQLLLPTKAKLQRGHHPALPFHNAPAFMTELRTRKAVAARCLEFTVLTAARSGEALGAMWSEIDPKALTWTIPAMRMKAGVEHVVPLSTPQPTYSSG